VDLAFGELKGTNKKCREAVGPRARPLVSTAIADLQAAAEA
jgi:hypothetical protein